MTVVDAGTRKAMELVVEAMRPEPTADDAPTTDVPKSLRTSAWPQVHARLVELVRAHRSTIVFVNNRRLAERLASAVNERAGEELALAHHGSLARERRGRCVCGSSTCLDR